MLERPEPPPWGVLISDALRRARISARSAAREAGISEGRWRQIAGGYQVVSSGVYAPVHGPAETVARMAAVAGVTPAQLDEAGRPDAAQVMAATSAAPGPSSGSGQQEVLDRIREMSPEQARELLATIAVQLGLGLPAAPSGRGELAGLAEHAERRYGT